MRQVRAKLASHFGESSIASLTPADAVGWRDAMAKRHARATVGRWVKSAKQFFAAAVEAGYLTSNPFAGIVAWPCVNRERTTFVDRGTIERIVVATESPRWHALIALSRFGGLRCPSEVCTLRWEDVDWKRGRFTVRAHKTQPRVVPLFPEIRDALMRLDRSGEYVIDRPSGVATDFRDRFLRLLDRAGIKPWPRLWHNLRASRETELAATYPLHVVCYWMGNSGLIAAKHYLTVREEDYKTAQKAAQRPQGDPAPRRTG